MGTRWALRSLMHIMGKGCFCIGLSRGPDDPCLACSKGLVGGTSNYHTLTPKTNCLGDQLQAPPTPLTG